MNLNMNNQKGFANIVLVIVLLVVLAGTSGYLLFNNRSTTPTLTPPIGEQPMSSPTPTTLTSPTPTPSSTPLSNGTECTDYSAVKLNNNQSFVYTYNNDNELRAIPEMKFEGVLKEYKKLPSGISTTLQRELTYNLDGKTIYTTKDDLSKYVGKRVILTGKNYKFELEGMQRDEIWPVNITCK